MLGVGLGLVFGVGVISALPGRFASGFSVPVAQIAVVVLVAAGAGVLAAWLPARRAGRLAHPRRHRPLNAAPAGAHHALRPSRSAANPPKETLAMNADTVTTSTSTAGTIRSAGATRPSLAPDIGRPTSRSPLRRPLDLFARGATYRRLAYLLLGLPLGTIWFAVLVTCITLGLSLLVVALLGIPVLLGTWYVVRAMANMERGSARHLLDVRIPAAPVSAPEAATSGSDCAR